MILDGIDALKNEGVRWQPVMTSERVWENIVDGTDVMEFHPTILLLLTLPYLTFGADDTKVPNQRSDHQVGPLRIPLKPKATKVSQMLKQA